MAYTMFYWANTSTNSTKKFKDFNSISPALVRPMSPLDSTRNYQASAQSGTLNRVFTGGIPPGLELFIAPSTVPDLGHLPRQSGRSPFDSIIPL